MNAGAACTVVEPRRIRCIAIDADPTTVASARAWRAAATACASVDASSEPLSYTVTRSSTGGDSRTAGSLTVAPPSPNGIASATNGTATAATRTQREQASFHSGDVTKR